jgi:hypothetical protein
MNVLMFRFRLARTAPTTFRSACAFVCTSIRSHRPQPVDAPAIADPVLAARTSEQTVDFQRRIAQAISATRRGALRAPGEGHAARREQSESPPLADSEIAVQAISPELVLIDPELARIERARLVEAAELARLQSEAQARDVAAGTPPPPPHAPEERVSIADRRRKLLIPTLAALSLLANGLLSAVVLAGGKAGPATPAAVPPASFAEPPGRRIERQLRATVKPAAKAKAERLVLASIIQGPTRKLPLGLVDRTTGLPKNNLQVSCRNGRASSSSSFLCVVRVPTRGGTAQVRVRYRVRRDGRARVSWIR